MILAALCMTSCSFLDKNPDFVTPDAWYKTEQEMQLALNGVYNRLIDTNGRMYSKGLFSYFMISDESFYLKQFSTNNIRVQIMDAAHLDIGRLWEVLYEGVNRANLLIASIAAVGSDTETKEHIMGEALFLRGYYYFLLTSFFGEVPLKLEPTLDPSDRYVAKSSLEDIYASIEKDMKAAEKLVADIDELGTNERISRTGVQAVLTRVYMKMAGEPLNDTDRYVDAVIYANEVINSGKHSLIEDYSQIFINHCQDIVDTRECIWEVGMYGNKMGAVDLAGSVGVENGIVCRDLGIGYSGGAIQVTKKLYDAFEEEDLRRDWSIAPYRYVEDAGGVVVKKDFTKNQIYNRNPGKWRREYETGEKARYYNSTNFPIIRYSDVLLMKAEALNRLQGGPGAEALKAVNQVRRRAYGLPVDERSEEHDLPLSLSEGEFEQAVMDERFREFCFEGRRKMDLIRWGIYVQTMNELGQNIEATAPMEYRYAANGGNNTLERNVLFPIPNVELTVNTLMTQNPGW